tara:strand:+ start:102 stop:326 length:225 start_codon:yes stop_codon:yes gene_type:complete
MFPLFAACKNSFSITFGSLYRIDPEESCADAVVDVLERVAMAVVGEGKKKRWFGEGARAGRKCCLSTVVAVEEN